MNHLCLSFMSARLSAAALSLAVVLSIGVSAVAQVSSDMSTADESAGDAKSTETSDSSTATTDYSMASSADSSSDDSGDGFWPPSRLIAYGVFGFAGNANPDIVNDDADELLDLPTQDIDLSIGGGLRMDWIDTDTPALGISLGLGAFQWKPEDSPFKPATFIHLTAQVRVRKGFADDRFEIYAGIPIDLGLNITPEVENGLAWGVGLGAVGGMVGMFTDNIGIFAEGGINYHFIFQDATPNNKDDELQARVIVRRVVLLTGIVVGF